MKSCARCGGVYSPKSKWCPACYDETGHLRPLMLSRSVDLLVPHDRVKYTGNGKTYLGSTLVELNGKTGEVMMISSNGMATIKLDDQPDAETLRCFQTHAINLKKLEDA